MLAIVMDLLTGRYGASEYNDRHRAEWPPHPARLFSALVAAWADTGQPDPCERAALLWLESQPPPQLACSDADEVARRRVVTIYVPGNDPKVLRRVGNRYRDAARKAATATASESGSVIEAVLPDNRSRQPRIFPSVTPAQPAVWFIWPDADPDEVTRMVLDGLLARVARVGHSSTLVSCRLGEAGERQATLVPRRDGRTVLRVLRTGLLDRLVHEYARHQGSRERLLPARMIGYGPPPTSRIPEPAGVHSGEWIVLDLLQETGTGERARAVHLTRSLELARAVRDALVEHEPQSASGVISGRFPDGQPRPHVAVVPLPDVGHRWGDGTVRGVALVLPRDERGEHLKTALAGWQAGGLGVSLGDRRVWFDRPRVAALDEGWPEFSMPLRRATWCRPSRQWVSVTPVALNRFVRALHDPIRHAASDEQARAIVSQSCVHTGLPEPVHVVISPVGMTSAVPPAAGGGDGGRRVFPRFVAAGSGEHKHTVHVALTFAEKVRGPVLLGAGRYLGYGLFLPLRDGDATP